MHKSRGVQADGLQQTLSINEKIKDVLRISGMLNMVAINAMLVAKRAGEQAKGFGVVSSELRVFSYKLVDAMAGLNQEVALLVRGKADLQKLERMHRLMDAALGQAQNNEEVLKDVLQRKEGARHSMVLLSTGAEAKLRNRLGRAIKLCDVGYSLARSAKVEAAYGAGMSVTLRQLAEQIEGVIAPLAPMLKSLRNELAGGRAT